MATLTTKPPATPAGGTTTTTTTTTAKPERGFFNRLIRALVTAGVWILVAYALQELFSTGVSLFVHVPAGFKPLAIFVIIVAMVVRFLAKLNEGDKPASAATVSTTKVTHPAWPPYTRTATGRRGTRFVRNAGKWTWQARGAIWSRTRSGTRIARTGGRDRLAKWKMPAIWTIIILSLMPYGHGWRLFNLGDQDTVWTGPLATFHEHQLKQDAINHPKALACPVTADCIGPWTDFLGSLSTSIQNGFKSCQELEALEHHQDADCAKWYPATWDSAAKTWVWTLPRNPDGTVNYTITPGQTQNQFYLYCLDNHEFVELATKVYAHSGVGMSSKCT